MNLIDETKGEKRKYELVKNPGEYLYNLNTYIKLMNYLWEEPKIVCSIIQNARNNYVENYLSTLFADNFYENILSSNFMEDRLMYLLTLLLEGEISKLNDINESEHFLDDNSNCGYLLEKLRFKKDIKSFFKSIIFNSIKNLEENNSSLKINFSLSKINDVILRNKERLFTKNENSDKNKIDDGEDSDYSSEYELKKSKKMEEIFNQTYLPSLYKDVLEEQLNKNKDNQKLYDFLNKKIKDCCENNILYVNKPLMDNIYQLRYSVEILIYYQKYFMIIIKFIDQILKNILENYHLLPYSIKCLCKIILLLVEKKFPMNQKKMLLWQSSFLVNY